MADLTHICGNPVQDGWAYCPFCGQSVKRVNPENMFFVMTGKTAESTEVSFEKAKSLIPADEFEIILRKIQENGLHVVVHKNSVGRYDFRTDDEKKSPFYKTPPPPVEVPKPKEKETKGKRRAN